MDSNVLVFSGFIVGVLFTLIWEFILKKFPIPKKGGHDNVES